nr:hypothetical protein [candidate division Zixibacteria bacterium]
MSRLESLKELEATLEHFLSGITETESESLENFKRIDTLDGIARESLRGQFVANQLGNWFATNRDLLESGRVQESRLNAIANLLGDIRSGLDDSDPESQKLAHEIDEWRQKGVVPKRKLVLKFKPKQGEINLVEKYTTLLAKETEFLDSGEFEGQHLLSSLDDILKSAAAKDDGDMFYLHLAGSIIYYLKINGYKVTPYAKRLKEIEKRRMGLINVE